MGDKDENSKIGFMVGGKFQTISEMPSLSMSGIINDDNVLFGSVGDAPEMVGTFKIKQTKSYRKFCRQMQSVLFGSNNWLKRHGLPMRRKVGQKYV